MKHQLDTKQQPLKTKEKKNEESDNICSRCIKTCCSKKSNHNKIDNTTIASNILKVNPSISSSVSDSSQEQPNTQLSNLSVELTTKKSSLSSRRSHGLHGYGEFHSTLNTVNEDDVIDAIDAIGNINIIKNKNENDVIIIDSDTVAVTDSSDNQTDNQTDGNTDGNTSDEFDSNINKIKFGYSNDSNDSNIDYENIDNNPIDLRDSLHQIRGHFTRKNLGNLSNIGDDSIINNISNFRQMSSFQPIEDPMQPYAMVYARSASIDSENLNDGDDTKGNGNGNNNRLNKPPFNKAASSSSNGGSNQSVQFYDYDS